MAEALHAGLPERGTRFDEPRRYVNPSALARMRIWVVFATAIALLVQWGGHPTASELLAGLLVLAGNALGYGYALRQTSLRRYPMSTLMILGATASYFTLPALGQLAGFATITHNLLYPVEDFAYALATLVCVLVAHLLYVRAGILRAFTSVLRRKIYTPIGFFRDPRPAQLWFMGAMGMLGVVLGRHYNEASTGLAAAVYQGLRPFIYLPLFVLVEREGRQKWRKSWLVAYVPVLVIASFMVNSRAFLLSGFASLGIVYVYYVLAGCREKPRIKARTLLWIVIGFVLVTGPIARLAMTMVVVRGERGDLSTVQLVEKTLDAYMDSNVIQKYERLMRVFNHGRGTDEIYYDNLFLNRLGNIKFVDNAVYYANRLDYGGRARMREIELEKIVSILPEPVLVSLGLSVNKKYVTSGSSGDFLRYVATGNSAVIGGFRTGSLPVNLQVTFGWAWPMVLIGAALLIFFVVEAWGIPIRSKQADEQADVRFNPLVAVSMYSLVFIFTSAAMGVESVAGLISVAIRMPIQLGVLYGVVYAVSRGFSLHVSRRGC